MDLPPGPVNAASRSAMAARILRGRVELARNTRVSAVPALSRRESTRSRLPIKLPPAKRAPGEGKQRVSRGDCGTIATVAPSTGQDLARMRQIVFPAQNNG